MVMRGVKVPKVKRLYIVHDVKREADRYVIAFGKITDPLGMGVERCMALLPYANKMGKEK
jgi:2-hydroxychromene-2-carboxylate isomerase